MLVRLLSILRLWLKRVGLLPWIKRWLYKPGRDDAVAGTANGWRYRLKLLIEQANFAAMTVVHDLPPIQAYWSGRYVLPLLESFGFRSLEDFWAMETAAALGSPSQAHGARILSVGSGNCDFEIQLAQRLISMGYTGFRIDCMDINAAMLKRGLNAAQAAGLGDHIGAVRADFNSWPGAPGQYRVVLANQSLHHVVNLEGLFDAVARTIGAEGRFIIHEMIGRNGHMRWPEALQIVEQFWAELPARYRFNRATGTTNEHFENVDCSRAGFEGIRAQDILPLLVQRFAFSLFIPFANVIEVFIDRGIGPNFDPNREWDRAFIDRVHAADVEALREGRIKPTHLLATITADRTVSTRYPDGLSPAACVRKPGPLALA
jgi:ubiquinone/menaquinone biosynthesis C-methylase UbiE